MARRRINRKNLVLLGSVVLLLAVIGWISGASLQVSAMLAIARNEPSSVVANSVRHDFGQVQRGKLLRAKFPIANQGGRRLIMYLEDGDCSCSTSDAELRLQPGSRGELTATLDTTQIEGGVQTQVRYRTNDPRRPSVVLTMLAEVKQ